MKKHIRFISAVICILFIIACTNISVFAIKTSYTVTADAVSGGEITLSVSSAKEGDTVNVTLTPDSGYIIKSGSAYYSFNGIKKSLANVSENATDKHILKFIMPAGNVRVYCEFQPTDNENYSMNFIGVSAHTADGSFAQDSFDAVRYFARVYYEENSYNKNSGTFTFKHGGKQVSAKEFGVLYAKATDLGYEGVLSLENYRNDAYKNAHGINDFVSYNITQKNNEKFYALTSSYADFVAEIKDSTRKISYEDYVAKAYIEFTDGTVVYSDERTDNANSTAERLGLININPSTVSNTLTISNNSTVNTGFAGFGVVVIPWIDSCRDEDGNFTGYYNNGPTRQKALAELDRLQQAGITKVRVIYSTPDPSYYDFTNKRMNAFPGDYWYNQIWVDMLKEMKSRNIEVMLNMCWGNSIGSAYMQNKNLTAVLGGGRSEWLNLTLSEQITAYGQYTAAFVKDMLDKGCDNLKSVTFYSEPGSDFGGSGTNKYDPNSVINKATLLNFNNVITTYASCVSSVKTELSNLGISNRIELVGPNISMPYDNVDGQNWSWWNQTNYNGVNVSAKNWFREAYNKLNGNINRYTYHYYGKYTNYKLSNYQGNLNAINQIASDALSSTGLTKADIILDEVSSHFSSSATAFNSSTAPAYEAGQVAEYLAAVMNSGYKGGYLWTASDLSSDNMFGLMPSIQKYNGHVYDRYYGISLVTKYFNKCSKIIGGTNSGSCVSVAAKDDSGNYVVMVVNVSHKGEAFNVNFESAINKTLSRHLYNPSTVINSGDVKTVGADKTFTVSNSFTDYIPAGGIAVYTNFAD